MTVFEILTAELPAIILTLKLSLITCFFLFLIGTPLALLLAYKKNKFNTFLESIFTLPLVLPSLFHHQQVFLHNRKMDYLV